MKTQACRLTQMMQASKHYKSYELSLPLVTVENSRLKKMLVGDVWLLNLETFTVCVLEDKRIIAELVLTEVDTFKVVKRLDDGYTTQIKLSLGTIQQQLLEKNKSIKVKNLDLTHVNIMKDDSVIAEASLVSINHKIAVQIDKVNI